MNDDISIAERLDSSAIGREIFAFAAQIYPICRSITGHGVRETLSAISDHIELTVSEVPTGTAVFDWTIPREWNIRDAYIKNQQGEKIVDFSNSNLHVMSYSAPVHQNITLEELKKHIYTLPDQPDLIPYRTSYYAENWAFCMSHRQLESLPNETYEAFIDSSFSDGNLSYGEYTHLGETEDEFLFSAHICHPSLANENCSGIALLTQLATQMRGLKTRYSYRFLFAPATIGAVTWLSRNDTRSSRIKHGLVVSMVGDAGGPTYKRSRRGDAKIDRAVAHVIHHNGSQPRVIDFSPWGYDERQYCSPGFDLPVGLFQRSMFNEIPQYHTSADNLEFISAEELARSYQMIVQTIDVVENDAVFLNNYPKGEPQLGRRGLYGTIGGDKLSASANMAMLWVLNLSDGNHSLLNIAERSNLPFSTIRSTAQRLSEHGLLSFQAYAE